MFKPLIAAAAVLALSSPPALAEPGAHPALVIDNQSGQQILRVYQECYGVTDCDWDDLLGSAVLEAGASIRIGANNPADLGGCDVAFRFELKDGRTVRMEHVNACEAATLTVRPPAA